MVHGKISRVRILNLDKTASHQVIKETIAVLEKGGLVIYPTETCYGVGVDATNQVAVDKLLKYKDRPAGKAISIAVADQEMAARYVHLNETARNLYKNFLPGPLTVISLSKGEVAKGLEAEDNTLGVRVPDYPLILELLREYDRPITATSANVAAQKTPYALADILDNISKQRRRLIDLILDAGVLPRNPPSTVVNTTLNELALIRQGRISLDDMGVDRFISKSEQATQDLAARLVSRERESNRCVIFALQGELGVGKTQFAKGIGSGLKIKSVIWPV